MTPVDPAPFESKHPKTGDEPRHSTWPAVSALIAAALVGAPATGQAHTRSVEPDAGRSTIDLGDPGATNGSHATTLTELLRGRPVARAAQQAAAVATYRFAIGPSALAEALREFTRVTGVAVTLAEPSVGRVSVDGLSGAYSAEDALRRLVGGTQLSTRFTGATTAVIELRVNSESVEVTAAQPIDRVASTKYVAPVSQTPQTIQVIPRTLIEEQGATTLSEVLRNVPGITMQAGEGGGASSTTGDMFNMRGFSAANSLFVDGVRDDGLISRDVYNLEQVDVYSGPTGSDVGRMNAAGYVNLTTKSPGLQANRSATFGYGNNAQRRLTADFNQPMHLGRAPWLKNSAVRLNVLWQDGGVAGRDEVQRESKSVAPSIALGLETSTRVFVSGQVMRQDNLPDYGVPAAASPVGPLTTTSVLAAAPVTQSNYYGSPDVDYDRVHQDSVTARVEHDFRAGMTLRNQTRYNKTRRNALVTSIGAFTPATNLVTLSRQANERHNEIFSNQTSLSAAFDTGRLKHTASLGLEVSTERQQSPSLTGVGTRAAVDINHPDVFSPVADVSLVPTGATSDGDTDTVALYAFDSFNLGSRTQVTGGVRVERYDTQSHAVTAAGVVTDLGGDDTLISGKLGVVFKLSEAGNVYVSYGSSLTPPGSANFQLNAGASNQNNPNVDPQQSVNYEIGSKWNLVGGRLLLSGAAFRTDNTNVIFVIDSAAVPPVFNQDDGQRVTGGSFGLVGQLSSRWDVNLGLQYLKSEVRSQNAGTHGHRLALTPPFAWSLWTTYRLPHDVKIGGGVRYTDAVFISTANTTAVPTYTVADAVVEVPVRLLTLRLNLYNLTDRVYIRSINNNGARYNPGTPRSFLLTGALHF